MSTPTPGERFVKVWGIGPDEPGIVYQITFAIKINGGSILRLRSMQLAGRFAITLVASFGPRANGGADTAVQQLQSNTLGAGFEIHADALEAYEPSAEGRRYVFTFKGPDRMGIVERIAFRFFRRTLNLEAVTADVVVHGPFTGTPTFRSEFHTTIPPEFDLLTLLGELEQEAQAIDHTFDYTQLP